jgi:hypothetical protein
VKIVLKRKVNKENNDRKPIHKHIPKTAFKETYSMNQFSGTPTPVKHFNIKMNNLQEGIERFKEEENRQNTSARYIMKQGCVLKPGHSETTLKD